ncbi:MAG: hypothetical protein JSS07_07020 [Proteobacteria bacterium]|nr:hypothetical protein [Pseudomonadota bacterium]
MEVLDEKKAGDVKGGIILPPFFWGATLGTVGYTVSNRNNFYLSGFITAGIGGGLTALFEGYGVLQILNVAIFAEMVNCIQNNSLSII